MVIQARTPRVASTTNCLDTWDWVEGSSASMCSVAEEYDAAVCADLTSGIVEPVVKLVQELDMPPTKLISNPKMYGFSQALGTWMVRDCHSVPF